MAEGNRPLAVVTGASAGIGYQLALLCARAGYDLVVASDEDTISATAQDFRQAGSVHVEAVQADLSTIEGNDALYAATRKVGRPVELLFANAGRGLGHGFLDQDWREVRQVIDTNVTGTIYLVQRIGRDMRGRGAGRILITGSIAGYLAGSYQAVYNGTKAFLNLFGAAIRDELRDTGVSVTVLKPGVTDTNFFETAAMEPGTPVGEGKKDDPADVAKVGFDALMRGDADIVYGLKNKVATTITNVLPDSLVAKAHRKMSEPKAGA